MGKDKELGDDFEEFDFNFDDDEFGGMFNEAPPATGRDAVTQTLTNAGKNFAQEFNVANIDNISKLLEKTIPSKLQADVSNMVELKDSLLKEVEAYGPSIKSSTNKLTKMMAKFLPKEGMIANTLNRLDEATSAEESYGSKEQSKDEVLNGKISEMISEAVGEKSKKEYFEEKIKESINYRKDLNTLQIQNHMAANLERLSAFNVDIASGYYRKNLELQYRQLDTQLEILTVNKVAADTFKNQLEAVVKNTALPDAIKLRSTEMVSLLAKNKAIDSGLNTFFGEGTKFDKMKKRAVDKAKDVVQNLEETLSQAAGYGELYETMREAAAMNGGGGGMMGSLAGDWATSVLGEKLGNKVSKTKFGNKVYSKAQSIMQDPSEYFKDKVDASYASKENDTFMEKMKRAIFGNLRDITKNDMTENNIAYGKASMSEAAIIDNRFYSTVTKDIPTILTGILQESASIFKVLSNNLGDSSRAERMIYDKDTDSLMSESETKDKISAKLENNIRKGGSSYYIKRAVDTILEDTGFKFEAKERAQIEAAIMEYSMNGGSISTKMFKDVKFLGMLKDKKLIKRIIRLNDKFSTQHDDLEVGSRRGEFGSNLNRALTAIQNPKDIITEYDAQGNSKILEELGIITIDKMTGRISVNNKKYKEMISNSIYNESLSNNTRDKERDKRPVSKETQELFDSIDVKKTTEDIKDKFKNSKVGKTIDAATATAMENETVKKAMEAKDKIINEFTGENLEKNLEILGNELTKESLKKRANQAYDFAVNETSEESIAKRKEQARTMYNKAADNAEELKKEFTKESLIAKEKRARKYLKETLTKEKVEETIATIKLALKDSGLEEQLQNQLGESKAAKLITDAITTSTKFSKNITEAQLTKNILREISKANNDIRESQTFKDIVEDFEEAKVNATTKADNFMANTKVKDKSLKEHLTDLNTFGSTAKKDTKDKINQLATDLKNKYDNAVPIDEQVTFVEKISNLLEKDDSISPEDKSKFAKAFAAVQGFVGKDIEEEAKPIEKEKLSFRKKSESFFSNIFKINEKEENVFDSVEKADKEVEKSESEKKEETLIEKMSDLISTLKGNKESIEKNTEEVAKNTEDTTADKSKFNDLNKDGKRDGSFTDRLARFTRMKKDKAEEGLGKTDKKEEKKESKLMSILMMLIPFAGTVKALISGASGLLSGIGLFTKSVFSLVSGLSSVVGFLGNGLIKPILSKVIDIIPGLIKMGLNVTTGALSIGKKGLDKFLDVAKLSRGAEGKMLGGLTKNLGKKALSKVPGLGIAAGAYLGYDYLQGGDMTGALGTWASTLLAQIPVIGTGASLGVDAWLMSRDMDKEAEETKEDVLAGDEAEKTEEQKRKEEEAKVQKEWMNNQDKIKEKIDALEGKVSEKENVFDKIENEKEKEKKELENKIKENTRTGSDFDKKKESEDNAFKDLDKEDTEEMSVEKKATMDDIAERRKKIQERIAAANGGAVYGGPNRKSSTAINPFSNVNGSEDRFAESTEPTTYKDTVGMSKDDMKKLIIENSKKAGMNPGIMLTMAAKESGMRSNAKNPASSALGMYQFVDDTWTEVVNKYGKKYGLTPSNANRLNPEHSTLMAAEYLKQNLAPIKKVKGGINATDAYLTHFLGPGGARKFLSSSPSASADSVVGMSAVRANPSIFTSGGSILSIGEVYKLLSKGLKKVSDQFGISGIIENTFKTAGGIENPTEGLAGGQVQADAKAAETVVAKENPFDSISNDSKIDVMGNKKDGSGSVNQPVTVKDTVAPNNNYYNSKALENKPMDVKNAKDFTDRTNMGINDTAIKNAVSQSAELSVKNIDELKSIATNTANIATNTSNTNTILNNVHKLLEVNNTKIIEYINSVKDSAANAVNNNAPQQNTPKEMSPEVISTKRGESMLDIWQKNMNK